MSKLQSQKSDALKEAIDKMPFNSSVEFFKDGEEFVNSFLLELKEYVDGELNDRPDVYECSSDPTRDYDRMVWLMKEISNKYDFMMEHYNKKYTVITIAKI